ncbi:MAG: Tex family protein [Myxococcota bacterium]
MTFPRPQGTPVSDLAPRIAIDLQLSVPAVRAAVELFEEGATVPFIARYRKERTQGLDEVQLRAVAHAREAWQDLLARRQVIETALREQGKLTAARKAVLDQITDRAALEDFYAPFKQKRKTRAEMARERGLQPLADLIKRQGRKGSPIIEAQRFLRDDVQDVDAALAGARDIVAEELAQDQRFREFVHEQMATYGTITAKASKDADPRFADYADHDERIARIPSHRYLAICRGESEGALRVKVRPDVDRTFHQLRRLVGLDRASPWADVYEQAVEDSLGRLLLPAAERRVRAAHKTGADDEAIEVFGRNLEALLLASPLGPVPVLGIDPGIRTGCKCALVSDTGELLNHEVIHLVGRREPEIGKLAGWLRRSNPGAVAVGNGTGGREALAETRKAVMEAGLDIPVVAVSESGASVYSASDGAREEMPDVDLTVRGAAHLARRLQDPLAELVKVPPGSLGVGQYQHDVDQKKLERRLEEVVESCVNRVGVDVNTASAPLLRHVAGIGPKLADRIVEHRSSQGPFHTRKQLSDIAGLGKKTFEQCAGFLRVNGGEEPLDASAVHPERYRLVQRIAKDHGCTVATLLEEPRRVDALRLEQYVSDDIGMATLTDIADELKRPGRDPRTQFEAPKFREDVNAIEDLREGMVLEGVVTNVANFGAFVDLGVHQDGLVHFSQLADRFVESPHDVVQAGQRVKVRVLNVDLDRKRISLSMREGTPRRGR